MEYEEIKLLKQSPKGTVHLVRKKGGEQIFIRKELKGVHQVYRMLQGITHPGLPKLYEVIEEEDSTTVIEEYIEGRSPGNMELSEKQLRGVVRQLCVILEFLHGKGIIHRDIKPSNLIFTEDERLYLIDFDAARLVKEAQEQDTRLLGTRGFAPPEQYGFSQTDERADIYALGATVRLLLGDRAQKTRYKRVIQKCMALDPDRRYSHAGQVRRAFLGRSQTLLWSGLTILVLLIIICGISGRSIWQAEEPTAVLSAPGNPHWDGETGIAVWDNVPESGVGDEVWFHCRLYRRDTQTPPDIDDNDWIYEEKVRIGGGVRDQEEQSWSLTTALETNGYYFFTVSAMGDGIRYTDSPYVVSDVFAYTGESAPPLPKPAGLSWVEYEVNNGRQYYAAWDNMDDYEDEDRFNVTVYDKSGNYVMNNVWPKGFILESGYAGIRVSENFLIHGLDQAYRFTVQVYSSRPNEYGASFLPDPVPEEYYSPWLIYGPQSTEKPDYIDN